MRLFALLQIVWVSLASAAFLQGFLHAVIATDETRFTWGLVALFILGNVFLGVRNWRWAEYVADVLPTLGLLGTVIGIKILFAADEDFDLQSVGVALALNTTIVGVVGSVWLVLSGKLLTRNES